MIEWYFVGVGTTALLLAVGHWFPWPRGLRRLQAYVYGVAAILVGCTIWLGMHGEWLILAGVVGIAAAGGIVTCLTYWVDDIVTRLRKADKAEKLVDHAQKR